MERDDIVGFCRLAVLFLRTAIDPLDQPATARVPSCWIAAGAGSPSGLLMPIVNALAGIMVHDLDAAVAMGPEAARPSSGQAADGGAGRMADARRGLDSGV